MHFSFRQRLRQAWFLWNWLALVLVPLTWYLDSPLLAISFVASAHLIGLASTLLPNVSWFGKVHSTFESVSGDEVWLTIDDGPDPVDTPYLLELLDQHHAKATFFFIGEKVEQYPELVRAVLERGHQLGNHTYAHLEKRFWAATPQLIHLEVSRCQQAIQNATGTQPKLFRAPVGFKNPWLQAYLENQQLPLIGWSCRGFDGSWKDPNAILKQLHQDLEPGAILLLHESKLDEHGTPLAPQVIAPLLETLTERKLRCVLPPQAQWR